MTGVGKLGEDGSSSANLVRASGGELGGLRACNSIPKFTGSFTNVWYLFFGQLDFLERDVRVPAGYGFLKVLGDWANEVVSGEDDVVVRCAVAGRVLGIQVVVWPQSATPTAAR